jgi:hypothetical protein
MKTLIVGTLITCAMAQSGGVSANELRDHVSYLASDKLGGRPLPSAGLDAAATYIAEQFKRIGLEPIEDGSYLQKYSRMMTKTNWKDYTFVIAGGGKQFKVLNTEVLIFWNAPLDLDGVELINVDPNDQAWLDSLKEEDVKGKVVAIPIVLPADGDEKLKNAGRALGKVNKLGAALILNYGPNAAALDVVGVFTDSVRSSGAPIFPLRTDAFRAHIAGLPAGATKLRVTLHIKEPVNEALVLSNVAGILRGSDPALKDTYLLVAANYEGFPQRHTTEDHISNSANTNASGVAALIEIARTLAGARPKRSILFLATSGEAPDGPGVRHYLTHPIVPFDKTVANINLTQLGRTDSSDGTLVDSASITGFGRSNLPAAFKTSAEKLGLKLGPDKAREAESVRGFQPMLLSKGVPAHTIYVAFTYPDARRPSDEAKKLDFKNMAKITQMIADGVGVLANRIAN